MCMATVLSPQLFKLKSDNYQEASTMNNQLAAR